MDGLKSHGRTLPLLSGISFDSAPFQIALSSNNASSVGGSAGIYKGDLTFLTPSQDSQPVVVAVKIFNGFGKYEKELLERELRAARIVSARHPFILSFLGTARERHQEAIVSLYMRHGNLLEYLKAHPGCDKKKLILQVADAVNHLHTASGLVHGDLKCANILVSDDEDARLANFGLSTFVEKSQMANSTATGIRQLNTVRFAAPELWVSGEASLKPPPKTRESDVYAFGMLILEAVTERPPWTGVNDINVMLHVCTGKRPPRPTSGSFVTMSHVLWEACSSCWKYAPEDRPSMKFLLEWLKEANFEHCLRLVGHESTVGSVAYFPSGCRVVSASQDGTIRIWDTRTGRTVVGTLHGHGGTVCSVAVSPDGHQICSGGSDATIRRWDADSGAHIGKPMTGGYLNSVAFSPDATRIVSCSYNKTVCLWDATTGQAVGYPPDGTYNSSRLYDDTVRPWDRITGADLAALPVYHPEMDVNPACFSPDRMHLVSGYSNGVIRIWDISTRQVERNIKAHSRAVASVVFSPSGRYIASGSYDRSIRIWDTQTGGAVGDPLIGHIGSVWSVAFSADGRSLVSGLYDGTVRIWDLFE